MTNKVLCFDLDGTLWDFERNSKEALQEIYHEIGSKADFSNITFDLFLEKYHLRNEHLWMQYSNGNATKEQVRLDRFLYTFQDLEISNTALAYQFSDEYVKRAPWKKNVYPQTFSTLNELKKKRYSLILMTNGFKEVQIIKLKASMLLHYFDHIFYAEDLGFLKPDIRFFQNASTKANFPLENTFYVGDNYHADIFGSHQAGMKPIMIDHFQKHEKKQDFEYLVINQLEELLNYA